ncbi:MAG: aldo/keto reductase [Acidobacteriota bacterium]
MPHSDLRISRIGFGCEQLGGFDWGIVDEKLATAAVDKALAYGVNFFDTANVYGLGRSEELLSKALGPRRHEVVIATKCGLTWTTNGNGGRARTYLDGRPETILQSLEGSLRRLRVDSISLCLLHWPDPAAPLEETLGALERLMRSGKIRSLGLSNYAADLIRRANQIVPISVVESPYSLINRGAENEVFVCCQRLGIGVVAYGALAQGLLTGKYAAGTSFGANDRRSRLPHFQGEACQKNLTAVQCMKTLGARYGKTAAQTAIRWVLDHPAVSCALFGAKSFAQVEENLGAVGWRFESGDYEWLGRRFSDQAAV